MPKRSYLRQASLSPEQRTRLEIIIKPDYEGEEVRRIAEYEGVKKRTARAYLNTLISRLLAGSAFHAVCNALKRGDVSSDVSEERVKKLNSLELGILKHIYPEYNLDLAAHSLGVSRGVIESGLKEICGTLGVYNQAQQAPYSHYAHSRP